MDHLRDYVNDIINNKYKKCGFVFLETYINKCLFSNISVKFLFYSFPWWGDQRMRKYNVPV